MEEKEFLLTQEGYNKLEKQLEYLKTEKRAEISERIKVALGFGDLSENSEYDEAKNAQADNEIKIADLENKLRYAKIIDESEIDTKTVQVGNTVKILDIEFDEQEIGNDFLEQATLPHQLAQLVEQDKVTKWNLEDASGWELDEAEINVIAK